MFQYWIDVCAVYNSNYPVGLQESGELFVFQCAVINPKIYYVVYVLLLDWNA